MSPVANESPSALKPEKSSTSPETTSRPRYQAKPWTKEESDAHVARVVQALKDGLAEKGIK
jgi:hypothetical protein